MNKTISELVFEDDIFCACISLHGSYIINQSETDFAYGTIRGNNYKVLNVSPSGGPTCSSNIVNTLINQFLLYTMLPAEIIIRLFLSIHNLQHSEHIIRSAIGPLDPSPTWLSISEENAFEFHNVSKNSKFKIKTYEQDPILVYDAGMNNTFDPNIHPYYAMQYISKCDSSKKNFNRRYLILDVFYLKLTGSTANSIMYIVKNIF